MEEGWHKTAIVTHVDRPGGGMKTEACSRRDCLVAALGFTPPRKRWPFCKEIRLLLVSWRQEVSVLAVQERWVRSPCARNRCKFMQGMPVAPAHSKSTTCQGRHTSLHFTFCQGRTTQAQNLPVSCRGSSASPQDLLRFARVQYAADFRRRHSRFPDGPSELDRTRCASPEVALTAQVHGDSSRSSMPVANYVPTLVTTDSISEQQSLDFTGSTSPHALKSASSFKPRNACAL